MSKLAVVQPDGVHLFKGDATPTDISNALGVDSNSLEIHQFPDTASESFMGTELKPYIDKASGKTSIGEDVQKGMQNFVNAIPRGISELGTGAGKLAVAGAEKIGAISPETKQRGQDYLGRVQEGVNKSLPVEDGSIMGMLGGFVPYALGGMEKEAVEAPAQATSLMKFLSGAKDVAKSGTVNAALGAAGSEGQGGDPLTGLMYGGGLGAGVPLAGKGMAELFPAIGGAELGIPAQAIKNAAKPGANDILELAANRVKNDVTGTGFANDIANVKFPEEAQIRAQLEGKTGSVQSMIDALEESKPKNITGQLSPEQVSDSRAIDGYIKFLKGKNKDVGYNPFTSPSKTFDLQALRGGGEGMEAVPVSQAPDKFSSGGLLYTKAKSPYGNQIVYTAPNGRPLTFNGNETIHLDPNQAEALKTSSMVKPGLSLQAAENPDKYNYPATDILDIRRTLDNPINFRTGLPNTGGVQKALLAARKAGKNHLIDIGGGKESEFAKIMEDYSNKLNLMDELKAKIASHTETGEGSRASQFLRSAASEKPGSGSINDLVKMFEEKNGGSYLNPAAQENDALAFANKNQPSGGKPSVLPPHLSWFDIAHLAGGGLVGAATHNPALGALLAASEGFRSPAGVMLGTKIGNAMGRGNSLLPAGLSNLQYTRDKVNKLIPEELLQGQQ